MGSATAIDTQGRVLTGARALFSVGNVTIGWATGVRWSQSYQYETLTVLANIEALDHVPVGYVTEFTASKFRIVGTTLRSLGFLPKLGAGPVDHLNNLLALKKLTSTIEDVKTSSVIAQFMNVVVTTSSMGVDSRGIMAEDVSFMATRCFSEDESKA